MASIGSPSSIASSPLRVPASGYFDGEDGEWSTFNISVGDPPQKFRVLPSAATGEVIVPGPEGCSPSDGPDCGSSRGVYQNTTGFWANESSTWSHLGLYSLGLMSDLGYETNASFGLDQVSIGESPQPRLLADQVIAGIASKEFDLGLLGLGPGPASFGDSKQPQKSLLSTLRDGGGIPSLSFGYTAGAFYQNPRIDADLILGGYDESRLEHNTITFPFDINTTSPISLSIQRISATGSLNGTISLLEDETKVRLDFTVPHLWLPRDMCDRFQTAFGLDYDNTTELYLVPENTRLELVARNPTIIFSFGASADPAQRVNVALPYNAFDLQVLHPLYPERLNYFPIRRAVNESQYTLGRAFFQEAYIIVDYGRANFSIHQAVFPAANESSRVITITEPPPVSSDTPREPSNSFSAGAIAGVVIGAVALLALAAAATFFIARRRKQIKSPQAIDDLNPPETKDMSNFAELAGSDKHAPEILSRELNEMYEPQERELYGTSRSELAGRSRSELAGSLLRVELPAETHQRPQELEGDSPPGGDRLDDRRS